MRGVSASVLFSVAMLTIHLALLFFFFSALRLKGSFLRLLYYSVRTSRTKVFFRNYLSLVRSTVAQNMEVCRRALRGGNRHRWLVKASSLLHR